MDISINLLWQIPMTILSCELWVHYLRSRKTFLEMAPAPLVVSEFLRQELQVKGGAHRLIPTLVDSPNRLLKLAGRYLRDAVKQSSCPDIQKWVGDLRTQRLKDALALLEHLQAYFLPLGFLGTLVGAQKLILALAMSPNRITFQSLFGGLSTSLISSIAGTLLFLLALLFSRMLEQRSKAWEAHCQQALTDLLTGSKGKL